ncbi:MAG: ABC transporter substrate-binding protein [Candidatus Riflebacteria bacterium]|nr:ABC transporter substrate-binding protein [Candidatus Riflebacteria bacterium]
MRLITDMAGRTVELPDKINRIYAPSPYASTLLESLCPEMLCGLFFPIEEHQKPYLNPCLLNVPVIGKISEFEAIKEANPDVILIWGDKSNPIHPKSEKAMAELGIPHIYACCDELVDLRDYPAIYRFLGQVLGIEERAEKLAVYCEETLAEAAELVNSVHPQHRPRVYYAEGKDGTQTEYSHSLHAHLLNLIGDVNIHRGTLVGHPGMEQLTEEQLLAYDPEVIIVWLREAYERITQKDGIATALSEPRSDGNKKWSQISAVKNNRVYQIPVEPFSYFDRPPCFMRILGLKWLLSICYPETYKKNFEEEKTKFLNLFFAQHC